MNDIYSVKLTKADIKWLKTQLLPVLEETTIGLNSSRKNSGHGRSQVFGYGSRRREGYGMFNNNTNHPELYNLLVQLGKRIVPDEIPFTTIVVNHNYKTKKHIDKNNIGYSLTVSLGDFTGGELVVDGNTYQTKYNPLIFNGALQEHYNKPITGNRYSLVYFVQAPKAIKNNPEKLQKLHEQIIK
jgi:hypothetical protein